MTTSRRPAAWMCAAALLLAPGCGGQGGSSSDGGAVNASSRLGWDQPAASTTELAGLRFVVYVDGTRTGLPDASCAPPAGSAGYPCSSSLPAMTSGPHTLQLASYIEAGGSVLESSKSAPLVITVSASIGVSSVTAPAADASADAPSGAAGGGPREIVTADGTRLRLDVVAAIDGATAIAVAHDGTLFIGDRAGRIHIVREGPVASERSASEALAPAGGGAILDLVLDPQFARNRLLYAIDTEGGNPPRFRLSRYREVGGRLGERAELFGNVAASAEAPSAGLAIASDGRLLVALDDAGHAGDARRAGSYNGKVLRLNLDGTTPGDQPGGSPVYASDFTSPRSLTWDAATSSLWLVDGDPRRVERLTRGTRRRLVSVAYRLPLAGGPAAAAVYRSSLIPSFEGSLLAAAAADEGYLLHAKFADAGENRIASTGRLAIPGAAVRLIRVGPDGAIYLGTDHEVMRLTPVGR